MGNQQLVSVPYALAANTAKTAEKISGPFIGFSAERNTLIQQLGTAPITVLTFQTEYIDSTNTFNTATGKFTAPETGLYVLNFSGVIYSQSATNNEGTIGFRSNSQGVLSNSSDPLAFKVNNERSPISYSQIVRLTAGETVEVVIQRIKVTESWQGFFYTFIGYKLK